VSSGGRVRRGRLGAAVLAGLLVTGCAQNAPGVAAQVGDHRITDEQVDQLAEALCVLNADSAQGQVPTQQVRRQALQILLDNQLADDIIDPEAVDKEQLAAARQQAQASRDTLPERLQDTFDDAVEGFASSQLGLVELGRQALIEKGTKNPDDQSALEEGQKLRARHAREVGVSVDPRFGTFAKGQLEPSDGSLSVPVSEAARSSVSAEGASGDLPANLACSAS
jgi:outer membrane murein-binding lipoprotein Lpp